MNVKMWLCDIFSFRMLIIWERHWNPSVAIRAIYSAVCLVQWWTGREAKILCVSVEMLLDGENEPSSLWNHHFPPGDLFTFSLTSLRSNENSSSRLNIGGICIRDEYHFRSLLTAFPMQDHGLKRMIDWHTCRELKLRLHGVVFHFLTRRNYVTDEDVSLAFSLCKCLVFCSCSLNAII